MSDILFWRGITILATFTALTCTVGALAIYADEAHGESSDKSSKERGVAVKSGSADESSEAANEEPKIVERVVVIGRKADRGVPEIPFDNIGSRDLFGPEQVRETGARTLNDLVQHIPAISTRPYNGGEAAAPSFSMRGLPDDGLTEFVHVLIDGVPANPMPYGWTAFSFMPVTPERIQAIDYIRGGHTVRYSPDTVGGVLNIVTQPLPDGPAMNASLTLGDQSFATGTITGGTKYGQTSILATYVHREGDGYRDNGGWDQEDVNLKLRWDIGERDWLAVSGTYTGNTHQAPGGLTLEQFDNDRFGNARPENRFDGYRGVLDVLYHNEAGSGSWWEIFATRAKTQRNLRAQRPRFGEPETISDWNDDSYFWSFGVRAEKAVLVGTTKHTLYGGLRIHREWIPNWIIRTEPYPGGDGTPTQESSFELNTFSAHIDDTFDFTERLKGSLGVRLEWVPSAEGSDPLTGLDYSDEFFMVLPGLGLSYVLSDALSFYVNRHEGFRAPQVFGFGSVRPGDNLDFERSTISEIGMRYRLGGGLTGAVTGWRTDYNDFHLFTSEGYFENLGRIVAEGVDVEANWSLGNVWTSSRGLFVTASITLQDSTLRSGPNTGNDVPYAWGEKAAWRLRYARGGWVAALGGTFVGESFSDAENTVEESDDGQLGINPSRTIWDLYVSRSFGLDRGGSIEVAAGATNLTDKEWYVHSRGGFFGGGKVAGPPRQGYVTVRYSFE